MRARIVILIALIAGCGSRVPPEELPALPVVGTESFLPVVGRQLVELREAVESEPGDGGRAGKLGMAYLAYRQFHAAEAALRRARLLEPRKFEWMYYHAESLIGLGRQQEALEAMEAASSRRPDYARARTRLGLLYLQLGDLATARSHLAAAVADEPANAEARLGLARLHLRSGQPEEARGHLERLLEQLGDNGDVYFALSDVWRRQGDKAKAGEYLALFEEFRGVGVPIQDPLLGKVSALDLSDKRLLRASRRLVQQGRVAEAIKMLHRALERNPDNPLTHNALLGAYALDKQFDKVELHYQLALESGPPTSQLLKNLGRARFSDNRVEDAGQAFEQALALDPYDTGALASLGVVYLRQERRDEGVAMLAEALERDPGEVLARTSLAAELYKQGRHGEALVHLRELVDPERKHSPRAWRLIGESHLQLGEPREAREAFAAAVASAQRLGDEAEAGRAAARLDGMTE